MKLCRFQIQDRLPTAGLMVNDSTVLDLSAAGVHQLSDLFEAGAVGAEVTRLAAQRLPQLPLGAVKLLAPIDRQEVWAAGVTYLRSKKARMEESDLSASAYDRVYEAPRPELFFKALPWKVAAPDMPVGIRKDARWNVPEPELALIINSKGQVAGCTIGNDMSSRDIEGENVLYLPQAKIYQRSCALGPCIRVGADESEARSWAIRLRIERGGQPVFTGETSVGQIKRSFQELVGYLFRSQLFPDGVVLLTGTGIVPPDHFTLEEGDVVHIHISGIGTLTNQVTWV